MSVSVSLMCTRAEVDLAVDKSLAPSSEYPEGGTCFFFFNDIISFYALYDYLSQTLVLLLVVIYCSPY